MAGVVAGVEILGNFSSRDSYNEKKDYRLQE
jgi:hypothetical protein